MEGGLDGLGPDLMHEVPDLIFGLAQKFMILLGSRRLRNPPLLVLGRIAERLEDPLGFGCLVGVRLGSGGRMMGHPCR